MNPIVEKVYQIEAKSLQRAVRLKSLQRAVYLDKPQNFA